MARKMVFFSLFFLLLRTSIPRAYNKRYVLRLGVCVLEGGRVENGVAVV